MNFRNVDQIPRSEAVQDGIAWLLQRTPPNGPVQFLSRSTQSLHKPHWVTARSLARNFSDQRIAGATARLFVLSGAAPGVELAIISVEAEFNERRPMATATNGGFAPGKQALSC